MSFLRWVTIVLIISYILTIVSFSLVEYYGGYNIRSPLLLIVEYFFAMHFLFGCLLPGVVTLLIVCLTNTTDLFWNGVAIHKKDLIFSILYYYFQYFAILFGYGVVQVFKIDKNYQYVFNAMWSYWFLGQSSFIIIVAISYAGVFCILLSLRRFA